MEHPPSDHDPRPYLAAERTFLAWIRTGIALMGFGFVVARFGLFLREIALTRANEPRRGPGVSLGIGLALIALGIGMNVVAAFRHRRYVEAIAAGRFTAGLGFGLAASIAAVLALIGIGMAAYLAVL